MNILDENILESQRQILQNRRIRVYQIGHDISRKGIQDDEIIPFLCTQRRSVFFTRDLGFYNRRLCHARYCLVCLAVSRYETAAFIRRLLCHPEINTQVKRMGTVVRVSRAGLHLWRLYAEHELFVLWNR
ncbi:MAG: hypothetical protein GY862_14530 [Gammaproteobacteria bacterium]|nr:hypothetical protein [Gammaproteobacteria bacterium]